MKKWINIFFFFGILSIIVAVIVFSEAISTGIVLGIRLCLNSIIPSLYFFMVVSTFIANTKLSHYLAFPFRKISTGIFHMESELFTIFLLSLIGGYPIGAKLIADQIRTQSISRETGQYLLIFCVNCSPAFLIGYLSVKLWNSITIGVIIYFSQMITCILLMFLSRKRKIRDTIRKQKKKNCIPYSSAFVESVNNTTKTMAVICSFVIVFCGLFAFIQQIPFPENVRFLLLGLLEVTYGSQSLSELPVYYGILMGTFFTSFGGVCVFLQVFAILKDTGIQFFSWFRWRILYCFISVGITFLVLQFYSPAAECIQNINGMQVETYTSTPVASIGLLILCSFVLAMLSLKTHRIHYKLPDRK